MYDERVFRLPRAPNPSVANLAFALESDLRNLIPERTMAESIWDGQGGDHLFFEPSSPFGAVDYAFNHGVQVAFPGGVGMGFARRNFPSGGFSQGFFGWGCFGEAGNLRTSTTG